jgi:hypothetical protein
MIRGRSGLTMSKEVCNLSKDIELENEAEQFEQAE